MHVIKQLKLFSGPNQWLSRAACELDDNFSLIIFIQLLAKMQGFNYLNRFIISRSSAEPLIAIKSDSYFFVFFIALLIISRYIQIDQNRVR